MTLKAAGRAAFFCLGMIATRLQESSSTFAFGKWKSILICHTNIITIVTNAAGMSIITSIITRKAG